MYTSKVNRSFDAINTSRIVKNLMRVFGFSVNLCLVKRKISRIGQVYICRMPSLCLSGDTFIISPRLYHCPGWGDLKHIDQGRTRKNNNLRHQNLFYSSNIIIIFFGLHTISSFYLYVEVIDAINVKLKSEINVEKSYMWSLLARSVPTD